MLIRDIYAEEPFRPEDVAAEVAAIIRLQPERHNQKYWLDTVPGRPDDDPPAQLEVQAVAAALYGQTCGSTACVAGWTAILVSLDGTVITEDGYLRPPGGLGVQRIPEVARKALGIGPYDSDWLFHPDRTRGQVLAALDSLAKGQLMERSGDADA